MWEYRRTYDKSVRCLLKVKYLIFFTLCLMGLSEVSWAGCSPSGGQYYCDLNHQLYPSAGACTDLCSGGGSGGGSTQPAYIPPPNYKLTVSYEGWGNVIDSRGYIGCGASNGSCEQTFESTIPVVLTATPSIGSVFKGWSGDCASTASSSNTTITVSLTKNMTCKAQFAATVYILNIIKTGDGTVTSDDSFINCGNTCINSYSKNNNITLTAKANTGSEFTGWSGDCQGTTASNLVTLSATTIKSCVANFKQITPPAAKTYTLNISSPNGIVNSNPTGITCGINCSASYNEGTTITLTTVANSGYIFTGWMGDCNTDGKVTLNANKSCTAHYTVASTPTLPSVSKSEQLITFKTVFNRNINDTDVSLSAIASSNLPVTFSLSANSSACVLVGNIVKMTGIGTTCIVKADQSGNTQFNAASTVVLDFSITGNAIDQNYVAKPTVTTNPQVTSGNVNDGGITPNPLEPVTQNIVVTIGSTIKAGFTSKGNMMKYISQEPDSSIASAQIQGDTGELTITGYEIGNTSLIVQDGASHQATLNIAVVTNDSSQDAIIVVDESSTNTCPPQISVNTPLITPESACFNQAGLLISKDTCLFASDLNMSSRTQCTYTSAKGGISKNNQTRYEASTTMVHGVDTVSIASALKVDPIDKDQLVDILVISSFTPKLTKNEPIWKMWIGCSFCSLGMRLNNLPSQNGLPVLDSIQPWKTQKLNSDYFILKLYDGMFDSTENFNFGQLPGFLNIFFGYRVLETGNIVFNTTPIQVELSVPNQTQKPVVTVQDSLGQASTITQNDQFEDATVIIEESSAL